MIAVIDYGMGNLGSFKRKLDRIGVPSVITSDPDEISRAEKLILPGVGHFASAGKRTGKTRIMGFAELRSSCKKKAHSGHLPGYAVDGPV